MTYPPNWPQSPYHSHPPWELQVEHRVTKAEGRLDGHDEKHEVQHVWNKAFAVALLSLGSAVAHGKADSLADLLVWLAKALKP